MRGSRHLLRGSTIAAVALVAAAACRGGKPRLARGARSMDELGARMVAAVSDGDTGAMHALRVTRQEHDRIMWPELPASRLNYPLEVAWHNVDARSVRDAARIAAQYRGPVYDLVGTTCRGGVIAYQTFSVHSDCWVMLRTDGRRLDAKLFGSVVEMDGRFKVIGILAD